MKPVVILVQAFRPETALEVADLALAFGLLDMPVQVVFTEGAEAHLRPSSEDLLGRWRTLLDFCPAQVFFCPGRTDGADAGLTGAGQPAWPIAVATITDEQRDALLQQAQHVVFG